MLAYEEDLDVGETRSSVLDSKDEALQEKHAAWRTKFLANLRKAGLDLEKVRGHS